MSIFPDNSIGRGTGTIVGKNSVLTAAHNLYSYDETKQSYIKANKAIFFTGVRGSGRRFDFDHSFEIEKHQTPPNFFQQPLQLNPYDYSLLKLKSDLKSDVGIGQLIGSASIVCPRSEELKNTQLNVSGYPAYVGALNHFLKREVYDMYTDSGFPKAVTPEFIVYKIDTSSGQSGANTWVLNEDNIVESCGIHTTGNKEDGNHAVRIDEENFEEINRWLKEFENL